MGAFKRIPNSISSGGYAIRVNGPHSYATIVMEKVAPCRWDIRVGKKTTGRVSIVLDASQYLCPKFKADVTDTEPTAG